MLTRSETSATDFICYKPVTEIFERLAPVVTYISLETGEEIGVTPEHPLWNARTESWMRVEEIAIGDAILDMTGTEQLVTAIRFEVTPTLVYNIEVEGTHTYFADGLWSHNTDCFKFFSLKWSPSRAAHVRLHNLNDIKKAKHGVFDNDAVLVTEEAWAKAQILNLSPSKNGSRIVFDVPMGRRIGWEGGKRGTGKALNSVRIVIENENVITAFPR